MSHCTFCSEFNSPFDDENRIIWEDSELVFIPTIGCFSPGYCLLLPRNHHRSFASMPIRDLRHANLVVEQLRAIISEEFGSDTIIAEHGPGNSPYDRGAACCEHAHLHLTPIANMNELVFRYRRDGGNPVSLVDYAEISAFSGNSYMYLSPAPESRLIWPATGFARQYVRRVSAEIAGVGDYFDWRFYQFRDKMRETMIRLIRRLSDKGIIV